MHTEILAVIIQRCKDRQHSYTQPAFSLEQLESAVVQLADQIKEATEAEGVETQKALAWIKARPGCTVRDIESFLRSESKRQNEARRMSGNAANPPTDKPKQKEGDATCDASSASQLVTEDTTAPKTHIVSNAAPSNVPPVAAAAEDVAGEEWRLREQRDSGRFDIVGNGGAIAYGYSLLDATYLKEAHNSCISRLQEQIAYWKREWNAQTASRDALLARAEEAEAKLAAKQ